MLSHFCHVQLFMTPWTVARQAPLSTGSFRQEYWSGFPRLLPGDLPDPVMEPRSLMSPALPGGFFTTSTTWKARQHSLQGHINGLQTTFSYAPPTSPSSFSPHFRHSGFLKHVSPLLPHNLCTCFLTPRMLPSHLRPPPGIHMTCFFTFSFSLISLCKIAHT